MRDNSGLVFVEVRYRKDHSYGGALESIDRRKQRKLRAAAEHYMQTRHNTVDLPCRFDVILITGSPDDQGEVDWITNAL